MRTLISITAVLAAASSAAAAPCSVSIARAPDDVRAEIERWVAAESRCNTTLEVRVVPTDGGYYLFARDDHGRVRERIVPDAKSAGVLVASWVADDTIAVTPPAPLVGPPPAPVAPPAPAPAFVVTPPPATLTISAPGMAATEPRDEMIEHAAPSVPSGRWLSLGAFSDFDQNLGVRIEGDFFVRGGWSIAGSLAHSANTLQFQMTTPTFQPGILDTSDTRGVVSGAYTWTRGMWQLRLSGGFGLMYTQAQVANQTMPFRSGEGVFPTAESTLVLSRAFDDHWAVAAGPLVTWLIQTYQDTQNQSQLIRRDAEITAFAGIRYRL